MLGYMKTILQLVFDFKAKCALTKYSTEQLEHPQDLLVFILNRVILLVQLEQLFLKCSLF